MNSDLFRELFLGRFVTLQVGLPAANLGAPAVLTNIAATDVVCGIIPVMDNGQLDAIGVSYQTSTGTTKSVTAKVKRGSTTLASVTASGAGAADAPIGAVGSNVNAIVTKGEALLVTIAAGTNDDDFVGLTIVVSFKPAKTSD